MLNQLLGGRYQIVQTLGEGGLAKTYIAEDRHRPGNPKCAVKFLKLANKDPNCLTIARRLFHKEAEILEKLGHHDQIPQSFAYFEEDQEFYLVQEFIEGYTLNAELPKGYRWSESKVIQMLQDVLQTLKFVHGFGVIHRDIKPNNLIRRHKDGRLVLIDFGAVKQVSSPEIANDVFSIHPTITIGTKGYMPPEQVGGRPRFSSDIYALGIIAIQALTGVHPLYLEEDSDGEVIWQPQARVSDRLATILSNMVRYHFKDRYQSTTQVLQALKSLSPNPVFARTSSNGRQAQLELEPQLESQGTNLDLEIDPWTPWNPDAIFAEKITQTLATSPEQENKVNLVEGESLSAPSADVAFAEKIAQTLTTSSEQKSKIHLVEGESSSAPSADVAFAEKIAQTLTTSSEEEIKINLVEAKSPPVSSADVQSSYAPMPVPTKKYRILIGAGIVSMLIGLITGYTYMTRRQSYLQAEKTLEQIKVLKLDKNYQKCVQQAELFPQHYINLYTEVTTLLSECQRGKAQEQIAKAIELAEQNKFPEAIALAFQIPSDRKAYSQAHQLISEWSEKILQIASDRYQEGNLKEATALVESVPTNSPSAAKAKSMIQQWDEEWQQNQTHLQAAQKALADGLWQDALDSVKQVSNTVYWQQQSQPIIQKAEAEIATAQAATSAETDKPSPSSTAPGPRSVPRSRSNVTRPRSVPRSRSNVTRPKVVPRSRPTVIRPKIVPRSRPKTSRSRSDEWICLNNPSPRCRR